MIMGSQQYGARFGTAVANVGDLNMDGYEGKLWSYKMRILPEFKKVNIAASDTSCVGFEVLTAVGYNAVQSVESQPTVRRNISLPSSGSKNKLTRNQSESRWLADLRLFYDLKNGAEMFIRNVCWFSTECTALYPRRLALYDVSV
jgi:hypothetical protein